MLLEATSPECSLRATSLSIHHLGNTPGFAYSTRLFQLIWASRNRPPGAIRMRPETRCGNREVKFAARAPPKE
jgi:hypothetical protein